MAKTLTVLSEAEYLAIEEAIATTAKGRAFLRARDGITRVIGADQVRQNIRDLQDWIAGAESAPDRNSLELIRRELSNVRMQIDRTKTEIRQIVSVEPQSQSSHIRGATAQLDEIVNSTAQATNDILAAAEAINGAADQMAPEAAVLRTTITNKCMDIFQACSFQDITGQRIAKVVKTLAYIEQRVNAMMAIGETAPAATPAVVGKRIALASGKDGTAANSDIGLLNGPQLPGLGLGQEAIDALLHGSASAVAVDTAPRVEAPCHVAPTASVIESMAAPAKLEQDAIDSLFR